MASLHSLLAFSLTFFFLNNPHVFAEVILEDGYTVTTVIEGHELKINPHDVLPRSGPSDLVLLDSTNSVFYTLQFPISQDAVVKKLAGDGSVGYSDGEPGRAKFNKPKSFAIDSKGNIYVADKTNHAIRKISNSGGVTTIAGGYSGKEGRQDGPAQNATFSNDFVLTYVPQMCALLVTDHGTQLLRQIDLKPEDCVANGSSSPESAIGAVWIWLLALGFSCVIGMVIGIAIRPFVIQSTARHQPIRVPHDMEALPNQSGETSTDTLLRHQKRSC